MELNNGCLQHDIPFISVVIPTYNRIRQLKKCVALLLAQEYPSDRFEIIIVNDGSLDDTSVYLQKLSKLNKNFKTVTISNKGFSGARNYGFRLAKGAIIASLDDDCEVEGDWLSKITMTFQKYPFAAAVGGSIINPYHSLFSWAQYILSFSKWFPVGKIRLMYDIPTSNIAYKKDFIKEFSFLEDDKKLYYRDSLFNFELIKKGGKIIFNPGIKVYHYQYQNDTDDKFYEYQKQYAVGFVNKGYKVHGYWGKLLLKYRLLNLLCPRLILIFLRCIRSRTYLMNFIKSFPFIVKGEWVRSKTIYREVKKLSKH